MAAKKKTPAKKVAANDQTALAIAMAIATVSNKVEVDSTATPFRTKPAKLMTLRLNSATVGISTPAGVRKLKANLTNLLPTAAAEIAQLPESPDLPIRDIARYVTLAATAKKAASSATGRPLAAWPRVSGLTVISQSAETAMRQKLKDAYGKAFSDKCSPSAARAMGLAARTPGGATREESVETSMPRAMVLEFAQATTPPLAAVPAALREGLDRAGRELLHRGALQVRISQRRDEALKQVAGVCSHLEQAARRMFGAMREGVGAPSSGISATEVCWLNGAVRSRVPLNMLAEVAADTKLERIDLPRKLTRELDVSATTVGGPAFRARFGHTGEGVVVAVIDGEVDKSHSALAGRVVLAKDLTMEGFGRPDRHGTGVAGIIGAKHATLGGIAPGVTLRSYKIFATDPSLDADDFGGAMALQAALEDGAHVANCSWASGAVLAGKSREARACDTAWEHGLVIIKSAGNDGPGAATVTSPAEADGIIVVGATDRAGTAVQGYSSRGAANGKARPHLVAPGGTRTDGIKTCRPGGGFGASRGTSFAAPHVAGLAALLLAHEPDTTPDEIRQRLIGLCRAFPANDPNTHGAGLVSLAAFV